jgi:hypothetical protein
MEEERIPEPQWGAQEWTRAWTIMVGRAYVCDECGAMAMVIKGGVGVMDPRCCGSPMRAGRG